jgi:hypothetical protein
VNNDSSSSSSSSSSSTHKQSDAGKQIISEEEISTANIKPRTYFQYLISLFGNAFVLIVYFLLNTVHELIPALAGYWLGKIGNTEKFKDISLWERIGIFFC